jgi:hypothetical protein
MFLDSRSNKRDSQMFDMLQLVVYIRQHSRGDAMLMLER